MGERLGRDQPGGAALLVLAREMLLRDLAPLLPAERRLDALLVANSMAIAEREAEADDTPRQAIAEELMQFYRGEGARSPRPRPSAAAQEQGTLVSGRAGAGIGSGAAALLTRFTGDLRRGAFERSPAREREARALLWRLTLARLRLANPRFLAANGLG